MAGGRKIIIALVVVLGLQPFSFSQDTASFREAEVRRILGFLASDAMKGRGNASPELAAASRYIAEEFRSSGLQPLPGYSGLMIPFNLQALPAGTPTDFLSWNGAPLPEWQFAYLRRENFSYAPRHLEDFSVVRLDSAFAPGILEDIGGGKDLLLWTSRLQPDGKNAFPPEIKIPAGGLDRNILLVFSGDAPDSISLAPNPAYYSQLGQNVVGWLQGKSRPSEVVIFSAHYDHVGIIKSRKDSIMNGANDNASGTTALLLLARYFAGRGDNERTLMFCAFAGEELGLFGSRDLSRRLNPQSIVAMINLEMIGYRGLGKNRVFITGEGLSDLPDMLYRPLRENGIRVVNEPNQEKQLFRRSDNYPFARLGVPAHTIMGSDDDESCYHRPCDEINRMDFPNMINIIRAIAFASKEIISGEKTPGRILAD